MSKSHHVAEEGEGIAGDSTGGASDEDRPVITGRIYAASGDFDPEQLVILEDGSWQVSLAPHESTAKLLEALRDDANLGTVTTTLDGREVSLQDARVQSFHIESVADDLQAVVVLA